ncbi:hypothetical protein [Streptomyces sp. SLBN-118]|uniref:hypothetical protein n=1 Tax=Streptomyces sp. SLBN-118 TaxID=2768454 RepID=UPI0021B27468|nr:hypothetical protein [Streptomyces sp. SLBN-118]
MLFTAALLAACGSGRNSPGDTGGTGAKSSPSSPQSSTTTKQPLAPADALSTAQLKSAALSGTDADGFQIDDWPSRQTDSGSIAEPAACQPVENVRVADLDPSPKAVVSKMAYATSGPSAGSATTIGLMAYDQSDAEQILSGLRTSLAKCTSYDGGVPARATVKAITAPDDGDEAVAFQLTIKGDPPVSLAVVRSGATVGIFNTGSGTGVFAELPDSLVTAQIKKLEQVSQE